MTHDPRLPTLEEIMNNNPFEIIDSPWGPIEAWRASTMATGTMGCLAQVHAIVRDDAAAVAARTDAEEARTALIQHVCDQIAKFEKRFDALEARLAKAEDQRRADQAREAAFNEEPLELPPDFRNEPPPQPIEDETHQPGGELHEVAAKEEASVSEVPEPELEGDDMGGVPMSYKSVPTSYMHGEDQVEFELPEPEMTTDARRKPRGSVYPQPAAISLNED